MLGYINVVCSVGESMMSNQDQVCRSSLCDISRRSK